MEPVGQIVYSIFRGTPRHDEWVLACLQGAWPGLAGERLAAVCRPCSYSEFRLMIEVLDPAWEEPLREIGGELLARIRTATGGEVRVLKLG